MKFIAYIFIISQFTILMPYTTVFHLYGRGVTSVIFIVALILGYIKLKDKEFKVFVLLTLPYCLLMLIQCMVTQEVHGLKVLISYVSGIFSTLFAYKILGLRQIFKCCVLLTLFNCLAAFVWIFKGDIYVDVESGRLTVTFLTLNQYLADLNENTRDVGIYRLAGFTGNPNTLGMLGTFTFIYSNFLELSKSESLLVKIMVAIVIIVSQSRAALLFILIYYILVSITSKKIKLIKKLLSLFLSLLVVFGGLYMNDLRNSSNDDVTSGRLDKATMAYAAFENSPINYQLLGIPYDLDEFMWEKTHMMHMPIDNSYLSRIIELGYIGWIVNFVIFLYIIFYIVKNSTDNRNRIFAFFIALFVYSFFENIILSGYRGILYVILMYNAVSSEKIKDV